MSAFKIVFWYWWALAAVLLVFEMMLPGVVFLFLAMGGAAAGLFLLVAPDLSLEMQLAVFAVIAVVSAVALRPLLHRLQTRTGESNLNARGDSLIGKTIVLDAPILAGRGRVKLGDGSWTVVGPDMVAGARVRVAAVDGTELRVEPAP
jgi:membrane protein implicated in regulation of membrane protease activity